MRQSRIHETPVPRKSLLDSRHSMRITTNRPVSFIHQTGDGTVHLLVRASHVGWDSLHWGKRLAEANEYVLRRFQELYYGHRCTAGCGPVDAMSSHKSEDLWGMIRE